MKDIIIKKIDNIIASSKDALLHIPASENGKYFESDAGKYDLKHILGVNQAYITGMALKAYKYTGDKKYFDWCESLYDEYKEKVDNKRYDNPQEVGILYWLYAVPMYTITGDRKYLELGLMAADELSRRFIPIRGFLKAWGRADNNLPPYINVDDELAATPYFRENRGLLLIETILNLPLLTWAHWESRQHFYLYLAESHTKAVFDHLVRGDGTTCHGKRFCCEPRYSVAFCEENYSGYSVGSYWAQGVASALYGLSHMQRYLNYNNPEKASFLYQAIRLINPFIDACNGDLPVWDFAAPDKTVDTKASAMALCAVHELQKYTDNSKINEFGKMLEEKLRAYIDTSFDKDGILAEQNGKHQYDVMGDYFISEAFLDTEDLW